jgi:hypothetical protein
MLTIQHFEVISTEVVQQLINAYNSVGLYHTHTMNKADPAHVMPWMQPILEQIVGRKLAYCSGNFYKHSIPYLPHTDFKSYQDNTLNIVIPLTYTGQQAYLVVFDQEWHQDSVTWCMHHPVLYFDTNTGVPGAPWQYPIHRVNNTDIDESLYHTHLSHYSKVDLQGLSGTAYPFEPGSLIEFDNKKIHCTSNFVGEKTGLSLRFKQ